MFHRLFVNCPFSRYIEKAYLTFLEKVLRLDLNLGLTELCKSLLIKCILHLHYTGYIMYVCMYVCIYFNHCAFNCNYKTNSKI